MTARQATITRHTRETSIELTLNLDGEGDVAVKTGIGFLDHLLSSLAFHARFNLRLTCDGDLHVDDHHTAEDCAIALGQAIDQALGERRGIQRFGYAYAPLDESLARAVIDLSCRPFCHVDLGLRRDKLGALACENIPHIISSLATSMRATVHVDVLRGENDHHRAESAFKALALAMREAVTRDDRKSIPSTKGALA